MKSQRGFTLLEMMVVVAIVAILAAILIPNFSHARAQAATSACMGNIKTIATAMELYYTDKQSYPGGSSGGSGSVDPTSVQSGGTFYGYLGQVPEDPAAGTGKYYTWTTKWSSGVNSYDIWCPGTHDASTVQSFANASTDTTIKYDSTRGITTASAAGK